MLKRSRARSPSPLRQHTSSPPLEVNLHHLPISKRRRIVGPAIDNTEHGDYAIMDGGEEDYAEREPDDVLTNGPPQEKLYAHMNQYLGNLHMEQQYRSRLHGTSTSLSTQINSSGYPHHSNSQADPWSHNLAMFNPNVISSKISLMSISHPQELPLPSGSGFHCSLAQNSVLDSPDKEREQVISRYEDTNRLLGSLVLSRRRVLRSPSSEDYSL